MVHLAALGASLATSYLPYTLQKQRDDGADAGGVEVWTVNRGVRALRCDLLFVLDEIAREARLDPDYGRALKAHTGPIITTKTAAPFEHVHVYPARFVLDCLGIEGDPYWHNSVPMILAYALAIGVKRMAIWGADYTTPDGRVLEDARANLEFWVGRALQRGMQIHIPAESTLCARNSGALWVYGLADPADSQSFLDGWPNVTR